MATKSYFYYLLLLISILISTIPGLGVLEFFRHTEADRALIAEEMQQTGNYIVPHLLGQPILTKPPIYYWLSAFTFQLTGKASEFEARLPSVLSAVLLAFAHFTAARYAGLTLLSSFASTLVLISSFSFFTLSALAEIDMLFAALCSVSLYLLYFSISKASFLLTILSYIFTALAFLTKGPPIIAFYAVSCLCFYFLTNRSYPLRKFVLFNTIGILVFTVILSIWLIPLCREIDFSILKQQFNREIVGRAISQPRKERGFLFYIGTLLGSCLPWTLFVVVASYYEKISWREKFNQHKSFLQFCAIVFVSGFCLLSLAKGKSSRYLFPLHTFIIQCLSFALFQTKEFWLRDKVRIATRNIFYSLTALFLVANLVVALSKLGIVEVVWTLPFLFFLCSVGFYLSKREIQYAFLALVLSVLACRMIQTKVYYPYRNSQLSVKPIVDSIHKHIGTESVYTAEMYERWIIYYLKKSSVPVLQLQGLKTIVPEQSKFFWLVTDKDESDLLELLKQDPSSVLVSKYELPSTNMFLYLSETTKAMEILNQIKLTRKERETY